MPSVAEAPRCLLCDNPTRLLYPSNVPKGLRIESSEVACTSPNLSVHDDIFVCRRCGLGRSVPPEEDSSLEELYRHVEDPAYFASEPERRGEFRRVLRDIEQRRGAAPGTLLEIGCSVGLFLDEAHQCGWQVVGIEPSRWAAEKAKSLGLEVFNGMLEEFDSEGQRFDVVASWDVWEHLLDPVGALVRAHHLLQPGGLLVVSTVNMGGMHAKILRGRWPWFMRMHLHYFTRSSLAQMVGRAGFEVLSISTQRKKLKLGYLIERAQGLLGPLGAGAGALVARVGLADLPVRIDLGDIILVEAKKPW